MIKATATSEDGRNVLILGLSHANLDRLRSDGLEGFVKIDGDELGIPVDIMITAGPTEEAIADSLREHMTDNTIVHKSDRYRASESER